VSAFSQKIKVEAIKLGFSAIGMTNPDILLAPAEDLRRFIQEDRHGSMDWLANTSQQRPDPRAFFPDAKSVIVVAQNYYRSGEKMRLDHSMGTISIYARGRDYHKVVRNKLKKLFHWMRTQQPGMNGRIFVDSFPIMEKPLAVKAGLGWIAKNSTLILKGKGSYFFLGGILSNLPLPSDKPYTEEFCGKCKRCQVACPTNAITDAFQLDARRCISYLTIEHKGKITDSLQKNIGNYIFGCDICQMVCPWNIKHAKNADDSDFKNRFHDKDLELAKLGRMIKEEYQLKFEGTPVRRTGYFRFLRNIKIALKNAQL
jgi:epoxyqueuosine reductase